MNSRRYCYPGQARCIAGGTYFFTINGRFRRFTDPWHGAFMPGAGRRGKYRNSPQASGELRGGSAGGAQRIPPQWRVRTPDVPFESRHSVKARRNRPAGERASISMRCTTRSGSPVPGPGSQRAATVLSFRRTLRPPGWQGSRSYAFIILRPEGRIRAMWRETRRKLPPTSALS